MSNFYNRSEALPFLGMGLSTEYGASNYANALDLLEARAQLPKCAQFLEVGIEVSKGLDHVTNKWISNGWPCTYHFLDINLDEAEDLSTSWINQVNQITQQINPAWLCGDAGSWHFGPRAEGHMLLLPPILTKDSAYAMADGICALREAVGYEILPENPPGHVYVGDLHLLDFFALVCERADTGMLLDLAHLTIYQQSQGYELFDGLDQFPLDRVLELHLAGGSWRGEGSKRYIEDSHAPEVLPETWSLLNTCASRLSSLKAVVFECERNSLDVCTPHLKKLRSKLGELLGDQWK